jgi:FSR family fosmidomycin resistance protein-like MFS transporter
VGTRAQQATVASAKATLVPLILFSLGHYFVDLYSGALGALQPLLVKQHGLRLAEAGLLGGVLVFSSSVTQPAWGYLSDRWRTRLFAALGPAVAGVFISALGVAPGYLWLLAAVLLGGAGVSAFHPQATSRATLGIGEKRGRAMAIFISAGTLGFACGPVYFSFLAGRFGLPNILWGALPGIVISGFLLFALPEPPPSNGAAPGFDWAPLHEFWRPITLLYTLVFLRSAVQVVFAQFVPLYLTLERGYSQTAASLALAGYLTAGALGGFVGGQLADRYGGRFVITVSMIGAVPLLLLFFLGSGTVALLSLALGGLVLLFTIPVNVTMAQDLVPSQAGTVSALMMGFAWGTSGLVFIPLTGWLSDHISMHYALMALLAFPVIGGFLALRLPKG